MQQRQQNYIHLGCYFLFDMSPTTTHTHNERKQSTCTSCAGTCPATLIALDWLNLLEEEDGQTGGYDVRGWTVAVYTCFSRYPPSNMLAVLTASIFSNLSILPWAPYICQHFNNSSLLKVGLLNVFSISYLDLGTLLFSVNQQLK